MGRKNKRREITFLRKKRTKRNDGMFGSTENCLRPDLPVEDLERLKVTFLKSLEKTDEEITNIERETVLQSESSKWMEIRRNILTASNFGKIVNKRSTTSASLVKSFLYKKDISNVTSIQHGRMNEKNALLQLEQQENVKILPCGLFIDKNNPYLGASPDGVIDENRIVEMKCPISGFRSSLEEAVRKRKITFWNKDFVINKKHHWYLQVQGQLNITGRRECLFAVWTGLNHPIKTELIERDQILWANVIVPKLKKFYLESMLPELLDPRKTRNMPLREINLQSTNNSESAQQTTKIKKIQKKQITIEFKDM